MIGPNGAGKTTVFNLLTGVYAPKTGRVTLAGRTIRGLAPHRIANAGLARTFQNIRLFGALTVLENVLLGGQLRHRHSLWGAICRGPAMLHSERTLHERAMELLRVFGLADRANAPAQSLSYGQQRAVEIARALATQPKVLLLDEPAAGMNTTEKSALAHTIRQVRDQFQVAILLIEHDMALVMNVCEQITVLDHGKIIAHATPQEIQNNPRVIEAYLGAG